MSKQVSTQSLLGSHTPSEREFYRSEAGVTDSVVHSLCWRSQNPFLMFAGPTAQPTLNPAAQELVTRSPELHFLLSPELGDRFSAEIFHRALDQAFSSDTRKALWVQIDSGSSPDRPTTRMVFAPQCDLTGEVIGVGVWVPVVARHPRHIEGVVDYVSIMAVAVDPDGRCLAHNALARHIFDHEHLQRGKVIALESQILAGNKDSLQEVVAVLARGGGFVQRIVSLETGQGPRIYHVGVATLFQETSGVQGVLLVGHDITELHRHFNRYRTQESLLTQVFETRTEGMALLDRGGRVVRANGKFSQIVDRPPAEVLGVALAELFPRGTPGFHGEFRQVVSLVSAEGELKEYELHLDDPGPTSDFRVLLVHDVTEPMFQRRRLSSLVYCLDRIQEIVVLTNEASFVTYVNRRAQDLLGIGVGSRLDSLVHRFRGPDEAGDWPQILRWLTRDRTRTLFANFQVDPRTLRPCEVVWSRFADHKPPKILLMIRFLQENLATSDIGTFWEYANRFTQELAKLAEESPEKSQKRERLSDLGFSPRAVQIVGMVLQGKPTKLIAADLKVAEVTVKASLTQVYRHFQVSGRMELSKLIQDRKIGIE